jgi:hypothetical protein
MDLKLAGGPAGFQEQIDGVLIHDNGSHPDDPLAANWLPLKSRQRSSSGPLDDHTFVLFGFLILYLVVWIFKETCSPQAMDSYYNSFRR